MTAAELIAHLQALPPDTLILVRDPEFGYTACDLSETLEVVEHKDGYRLAYDDDGEIGLKAAVL